MVHEFLITWKKLVAEVIRFLDSTVPYPVSAISGAVDFLCCVAISKFAIMALSVNSCLKFFRAQYSGNSDSHSGCFRKNGKQL